MKIVKDRFLKYVSFDTQSQDGVEEVPSTAKQLELAKFLVEELKELGLSEVELLDHGYVLQLCLPQQKEIYRCLDLLHIWTPVMPYQEPILNHAK